MDFSSSRPIYLQIADSICERVLREELKGEDRIPSVREYGASLGVNPNTMMRTYERLTADGIIYNRRGIGYFVCPDARDKVLEAEKSKFIKEELPAIRRRIQLLNLDYQIVERI